MFFVGTVATIAVSIAEELLSDTLSIGAIETSTNGSYKTTTTAILLILLIMFRRIFSSGILPCPYYRVVLELGIVGIILFFHKLGLCLHSAVTSIHVQTDLSLPGDTK